MLNQPIVTSAAAGARQPVVASRIALVEPPQFHIIDKVILIGASDRTQKPKPLRTIANTSSPTSQPRKAGRTTKAIMKPAPNGIASLEVRQDSPEGQLVILEGILRYREVEDEVNGTTFKHRIAEIHAISMKRLSKVEAADDP